MLERLTSTAAHRTGRMQARCLLGAQHFSDLKCIMSYDLHASCSEISLFGLWKDDLPAGLP